MKLFNPFFFSFIFDVTKSPYFEIEYLAMAIGIPACANCIVAIDTIFMGLCLHGVALFKDLKENIAKLDDNPVANSSVFVHEMGLLMNYHDQILDLMKEIEATFSRLFFTQFIGTIFILCSQSYLATMVNRRAVLWVALWDHRRPVHRSLSVCIPCHFS